MPSSARTLAEHAGALLISALGTLGVVGGLLVPVLLPDMIGLVISAALLGLSNVYFIVPMQSLVNRIATGAERARNVANFSLAVSIGQLVGPVLAGLLIDLIGHRFSYLVLAVLPLGTLAMLYRMRNALPPKPGSDGPVEKPDLMGMLSNRSLRPIFITSAIAVASFDLYSFFLPIYGHSIGLSASKIGLVLGTFAAAAFVIRAIMPWLIKRVGEVGLLVRSLLLSGIAYLLFPFVTSVWLLALLSFVLGLGVGCGQTPPSSRWRAGEGSRTR
jgi:predicted MFS family arabinose efflux permease